jgi:hypothetical protein
MKRVFSLLPLFALTLLLVVTTVDAQTTWAVGGRLGISIGSYGASTPAYGYYGYAASSASSTSAGLQIGPTGEVIFNRQFAIATEFNINTQGGTPIEWANSFKVYFPIQGSKIRPYADAGFSLWFITGGPYFGIRGGGGALFPIANKLYIPADLQLGPVFLGSGAGTFFYIAATTGIRYEF